MKSKTGVVMVLFVILLAALTACAGEALPPDLDPTPEEGGGLPPVAALRAREALAAELDIPLDEVVIVSQEQAEWSDSCLGLAGIAESCLQVIVPGWRVELSANGRTFIARTDESGESIRFEDQDQVPPVTEAGGIAPFAAVKARLALAAELGIPQDTIEIVSQERAEWTDSCLGLGGIAESCLQVIVPGWRVTLSANGETYFARTDETGESTRFEDQDQVPPVTEPATESEGSAPVAAVKAQEALAEKLGVGVEQVTIISFEWKEWPDGCLGLGGPNTMCTMAIVPGWRVELSAKGQTYVARTDEAGNSIRFE